MSALRADRLSLAYDHTTVIDDLDLCIPSGRITALVGPNGCGKSTLLRGLARRLGILPQGPVAPEGLTVRELVAQGRYPHQRWFQQWREEDEQATAHALAMTGMVELAERHVDQLSGGQRQRARIAMALAQETEILLLDEPTTFLDMAHQLEVLHLLQQLNHKEGRTIVMVLHDLNHAARYAHLIVAISEGEIVTSGMPCDVVTPQMLRAVFGVEAHILSDPESGVPLCIPYGLCDGQGAGDDQIR